MWTLVTAVGRHDHDRGAEEWGKDESEMVMSLRLNLLVITPILKQGWVAI